LWNEFGFQGFCCVVCGFFFTRSIDFPVEKLVLWILYSRDAGKIVLSLRNSVRDARQIAAPSRSSLWHRTVSTLRTLSASSLAFTDLRGGCARLLLPVLPSMPCQRQPCVRPRHRWPCWHLGTELRSGHREHTTEKGPLSCAFPSCAKVGHGEKLFSN